MSIQPLEPMTASGRAARAWQHGRQNAESTDALRNSIDRKKRSHDPGELRQVSILFSLRYISQAIATAGPLFVADAVALVIAWQAASLFGATWSRLLLLIPVGVWILLQPLIGAAIGVYPGVGLSPLSELRLTTTATSLWVAVLGLIGLSHDQYQVESLQGLFLLWAVALVLVPLLRSFTRKVVCRWSWWGQPAIIFGGGPEAALVYRRLIANPSCGLRPVGVIGDWEAHWTDRHIEPAWYLGPPSEATRWQISMGFSGASSRAQNSVIEMANFWTSTRLRYPHLSCWPAVKKI